MQTVRPFIRYDNKIMHSRSRPPAWETIEYPALSSRYKANAYDGLPVGDSALVSSERISAVRQVYREQMSLYKDVEVEMKQDTVMSFYCKVIDSSVYMPYGDGTEGNPYRDLEWALSDIRCVMRNTCYKHRAILHLSGNVTELGPHLLESDGGVGKWNGELYIDGLQEDGSRLSFSGGEVRLSGVHLRNMNLDIPMLSRSGFFFPVSLYNVEISQFAEYKGIYNSLNPIIVYKCKLSNLSPSQYWYYNDGGILFAADTVFTDTTVCFKHRVKKEFPPETFFLYKDNFEISTANHPTAFAKNCTFKNTTIQTENYSACSLATVDCKFQGSIEMEGGELYHSLCIRPTFEEISQKNIKAAILVDAVINTPESKDHFDTTGGLWDNVKYTGGTACTAGSMIDSIIDVNNVSGSASLGLMENSEITGENNSGSIDTWMDLLDSSDMLIRNSTINVTGNVNVKSAFNSNITSKTCRFSREVTNCKIAVSGIYSAEYVDPVGIIGHCETVRDTQIDLTVDNDSKSFSCVAWWSTTKNIHNTDVRVNIKQTLNNIDFNTYYTGRVPISATNSTVSISCNVVFENGDNSRMIVDVYGSPVAGIILTPDVKYQTTPPAGYYYYNVYITTVEPVGTECGKIGFRQYFHRCDWNPQAYESITVKYNGTTATYTEVPCPGSGEVESETIDLCKENNNQ